jgi:hypothetical protein
MRVCVVNACLCVVLDGHVTAWPRSFALCGLSTSVVGFREVAAMRAYVPVLAAMKAHSTLHAMQVCAGLQPEHRAAAVTDVGYPHVCV